MVLNLGVAGFYRSSQIGSEPRKIQAALKKETFLIDRSLIFSNTPYTW